ncbi:MAG: hypothetical protein ACFFD2_28505 [Promethearchaeota archaeon]
MGTPLRPIQALWGNSLPVFRSSDKPQKESLGCPHHCAGWLESGDGRTVGYTYDGSTRMRVERELA